MFKPKFFSIFVIVLMVFSTMGGVSATITKDTKVVNDDNVIVVDNPTVSKIQQVIDDANDNDTILIKGSTTDTGNINCNKILTIKGENCTLNKVHWKCSKDITFENIDFRNCKSEWGGAIDSKKGSVTVSGSSFVDNTADKQGGAICAANGSVIVSGSSFVCNYVEGICTSGGAICADKGSVIVSGSSFVNNSAWENGGAIYSWSWHLFLILILLIIMLMIGVVLFILRLKLM